MVFPSLRAFIEQLRLSEELAVVDAEVDPDLEVAEIHRRVIAANGPALLFNRPRGSRFRLVTNLFGTQKRAEMAFGQRPQRVIRRLTEVLEDVFPPSLGKLWKARDLGRDLLRVGTRRMRSAPVLENRPQDFQLDWMPVLKCWPQDGGPFITLPLVYTEHPEGKGHNLGIYRMQIYDGSTAGMHWQIGKGGGFHYAVAEEKGEALPATVFLGGPPALILAAIAPLPENVPELVLASLIMGKKLGLAELDSGRVVAESEFALQGEVPAKARQTEGPFGDHYGYYSLRHDYPVFELKQAAYRRDAIYPATVVGKPRQEDFFIGDLLQELLSPLFPVVMPSVSELWSYGETGYHSLAAAVVRQRYKREAMTSAFRILGEGQLSLTKFLLLTDQPVDLKNFKATLQHLLRRTRTETDLYIFSNLSMDTLDYTGPRINEGSKGVWLGLGDPVRDLPQSFTAGELPSKLTEVRVFCPGCLVLGGPTLEEEPGAGARFVLHPAFQDWPLLVLSDQPARAAASSMNFLWTTFTRFEPAADVFSAEKKVIRNQISYRSPILIDARVSKDFPPELRSAPETAEQVTRRWKEYFPDGMEMGDSETAHLTPERL